MIVCNSCGVAVGKQGAPCSKCAGKGVEYLTPLKGLLTPIQSRGSQDRWAERYTTPSPTSDVGTPGSVRSIPWRNSQKPSPSPLQGSGGTAFDIEVGADTELARVYGSVLQTSIEHPSCQVCEKEMTAGAKIYLASRDYPPDGHRGDELCRDCFTKLFQIGECRKCLTSIIGDREEGYGGGHITGRARDDRWHAKCFICHGQPQPCTARRGTHLRQGCGNNLYGRDHLLLVTGDPSCPSCFDRLSDECNAQHTRETTAAATATRRYAKPRQMTQKTADSRRLAILPSSKTDDAQSESDVITKLENSLRLQQTAQNLDLGGGEGVGALLQPTTDLLQSTTALDQSTTARRQLTTALLQSATALHQLTTALHQSTTALREHSQGKTQNTLCEDSDVGQRSHQEALSCPQGLATPITVSKRARLHESVRLLNTCPAEATSPMTPLTSQYVRSPRVKAVYGGMVPCPGCGAKLALMEKYTAPGPGKTRWHSKCLRCGSGGVFGFSARKGCGKLLDATATMDKSGQVSCRNCLLQP